MATIKKETVKRARDRSKKSTVKETVIPVVKKPDVKIESVMAKHVFTPEEKEQLFKRGYDAKKEIESINANLTSIKKTYGANIEAQELIETECFRKYSEGSEMRQTPAVIVFNYPIDNRKTAYRYDESQEDGRGELIEETDMSAADKERDLFERKPHEAPQEGVNAPAPESKGEFSDDQIAKATMIVRQAGKGSTVLLQRLMSIGYSMANRLIGRLEELGVVGPMQPGGERELIPAPDNPVLGEGFKVETLDEKNADEKNS